jgi:hypothetical protein
LKEALDKDQDHLYRGLLTVMLRLVFILYAEDRSLLPVEHPLYAKRMSLLGLFERLQRDHGNFPDSMSNRFGAWGHIISLCRAIYLGVDHGDFHIPPRQGDLFDPHQYKFLEGWVGDSAPVITHKARSEVQVPTVDDGTVFYLLRSLLIFQGQRLSYRTLDVEQIGSVYEALMGYQVQACESQAVAIKINNKKGAPKYWLEPNALQAVAKAQRLKWLQNECGFDKATATKIKKAVDAYEKAKPEADGTLVDNLLPFSSGKNDSSIWNLSQTGEYVLQPGAERRRSGSHYTPRSLTSPIVQKTLEPLFHCLSDTPTAQQILELKICDPAMGSGAFLVECCRQLADEVVAAWGREKKTEEIATLCPEGDVVAYARRLVAQRCLYGVDKNIMAVQLAKLSLWLFTLSRDLPFTFLDHSLRYGDSLVGLDFEQIKSFHWKPEKQISFIEEELRRSLDEVVAIRQEIHFLAGDLTPAGQKLKAQRLFDADDATEKVRKIADTCVGAFFDKDKNKQRLNERQRREDLVMAWLGGDEESERIINLMVKKIRHEHSPFHWWLEFPEVFYEKRPDPISHENINGAAYMEAFVGNPPFLGGNKITETQGGPGYQEWLKASFTGVGGSTDLCAYFFRQAFRLIGSHGTIGLIATNTISEGGTRSSGLQSILKAGGEVYNATVSIPWPGDAVVVVTVIHIALGQVISNGLIRVLNGIEVKVINSRLLARPELEDPVSLKANTNFGYMGSTIVGSGFNLEPEEYEELASNGANAERLFPLLGGQDINASPTQSHSRYVINFGSMSLAEAERWPELLDILREKVKPQRMMAKDHGPGAHGKKFWWQHILRRDPLYESIRDLPQCIVAARITSSLTFSFQSTDQVFTDSVIVFPFSEYTQFSILQSRLHETWARLVSSTLGSGLRYSVSDCFETFPFPDSNPRLINDKLELAGAALYDVRAKYMEGSYQGLTAVYNALKDPGCDDDQVLQIRCLHEALDRSVLDSYGWFDIEVPPFCPITTDEEKAVESFNVEVIDRLYVLNAERAEEERQGLTKAPATKLAPKKAAKKPPEGNPSMDLF